MVTNFLQGIRSSYRREMILRRARKVMADPGAYSYRTRAEVYRELASIAKSDTARDMHLKWAEAADRMADRHEG